MARRRQIGAASNPLERAIARRLDEPGQQRRVALAPDEPGSANDDVLAFSCRFEGPSLGLGLRLRVEITREGAIGQKRAQGHAERLWRQSGSYEAHSTAA